ncbi:long-chain-fatty-acid--CoA ligase [Bordetella bronchiseptica M85/00/2]|nr:AMP-binding protein [Bordetella bronchiseptica]KDC47539.1 long-chain-fatty-acid--CoA ligase [Bordetella bronchiseptica M85/00/2]
MPAAELFATRLDTHARERPEAVALIDRDRPVTHAALRAGVLDLAGGLAALGVCRGERVALWLPNCAHWVTMFLACARLGALTLAVNTRFRAQELGDILGRGQADWLVYWPGFKGIDFAAILAAVPPAARARLRGAIVVDGSGAQATPGPAGLAAHALAALHGPAPLPAPNAGVLCFTTSGTTSLPKFVLHDQDTLLRHGDAIARSYGYDDDSRILASAPFCGAFGFATLVGALARGVPVICEPAFDAARSVAAIRRHRVTHTYANNEALVQMFRLGERADFATARLFGFASFAPALGDLLPLARAQGVPLTGLYGSSELIALVAAQPREPADGDVSVRYEPGGALIHPEARVRARDPQDGRILADGESGEIEILAPSLMRGYLDNPQASAGALTDDGYFRTGDLGYTLGTRQFVFQTRMGDSLRLSGFLVNPAEIEQAVEALPGIRACQVVGATRDGKTVPYAFVLLDAGASPDPPGWMAACRQGMAGFKVPAGFQVLEAFPVVESANSAKIQKHKLREQAEALLAAAPAA